MAVAVGANLSKGFGAEHIFDGVTFEIQERDRVALVGINGSGKSTLLRILAGMEQADAGTLTFSSGTRVGYLPQEVHFPPQMTLQDYLLSAFERLRQIETELRAVEHALGNGAADGSLNALMERHARLQHEYEHLGGYRYRNRMHEVLAGLGLGQVSLDQTLATCSGGQRTRVALARLLLTAPDLLLLDEPTNHLDLAAMEWLEDYLNQTPQAIVVVSHDRYFLDAVATRTWELDGGHLETYVGNYSRYVVQRDERRRRQRREYEAQQEHIARTEAFIRQYKAGQRAREARGRQKKLDRLERVERPRDAAQVRLAIQSTLRSGDTVLATEELMVAAGTAAPVLEAVRPGQPVIRAAPRGRAVAPERVLFRCPDLELRRGERVAIVGPNGAGKTTLLRVITGEAEPAAGRLYLGYGVQVAYYAQAHEQLDSRRTVIEEIQGVRPLGDEAARTYLGRFLFTGDDVFKRVSSLSGGERSRLALAKLALGEANFLVLDEPTNHLDIYAREALEDVLRGFKGTILFVSHDRYLIDAVAQQIWEIADKRLTVHLGTWAEYAERRRQAQSARVAAAAAQRAAAEAADPARQAAQQARARAKELSQTRARLEQLEAELAASQARLAEVAARLEAASAAADVEEITELGRQHVTLTETLAQREEEWLALHETLEALEGLEATPGSKL
ncbi:MAG TPA: ABC-F family ATP-binding cassette domain-containing protein [Chloroflexota bacterium]|nr:ABC-F family ATP-binding cassette domain-containing protein [Chloroflexota bacterium]